MSRQNLEAVVNCASKRDWELGLSSWRRYNRLVGLISLKNHYGLAIGAAVFAALSPNSDYLGNLRDTNRLLLAARRGLNLDDFKVSAYGPNKEKAWRIAHGEDPLDLIVANKTRNFFLNVMDPDDPVPVTVDGHVFCAWQNKRLPLDSAELKALVKRYEEVASHIRAIAFDRKVLPNVIQGVIWHSWKRINGVRTTTQMCFWAEDAQMAQLEFEPDW